MLLARRLVAWGSTETVLAPRNLEKARNFDENWDETAPWCEDCAPDDPQAPMSPGTGAGPAHIAGGTR